MTEQVTAAQVERRYLALSAARWLPVGLFGPVFVLFALDRGLSIGQIGAATLGQSIAVVLLELPTGGAADALGRRPVLLLGGVINVASLVVVLFAHDVAGFAAGFALQGVYRALESGPLDAWFVDAVHLLDPEHDIERALSHASVMFGVAMGAGASVTAVLMTAGAGLEAPMALAVVLAAVHVVLIAWLMTELKPARGAGELWAAVTDVPNVIRGGLRIGARNRAVRALVGIEVLWSMGLTAVELLWQPRLVDLTGATDAGSAASSLAGATDTPLFGLTYLLMFGAGSVGAAAVPWLTRRLGGAAVTGAWLRVLQGGFLLVLAGVGVVIGGGVPVFLAAIALVMAVHGASNPVHQGLLHKQITAEQRATVLSLNSLGAQAGGGVGSLALAALAGSAGIPWAWVIAAVLFALPAPLYLVVRRHGVVT